MPGNRNKTRRSKNPLASNPAVKVARSDLTAAQGRVRTAQTTGRGLKSAQSELDKANQRFLRTVNRLKGRPEGKV